MLRRLGGREFAAIAGTILAARSERVPVILDGFTALATAAVLHAAQPAMLDHCLLAGLGGEPGEAMAAERLGLEPLLEFGAAGTICGPVAAGIVKAAALCHAGTRLATTAAG
jgi:nicotinate-nucleotide--dimethylbenzimidazole phosphoribosyltransferase